MDLADLTRDLEALQTEALASIAAAHDVATLEALVLDVLGKKGRLTGVLRGIGALPAEDRPRVGAIANTVRSAIESAMAERGSGLKGSELASRLAAEAVDVTTPGRPIRRGTLHPVNETIAEIAEIFGQFGFVVYEGPEIEDDVRNFQMLNIPPDHPARDLWDTLYVDVEGHLLRTHTSPGQIRVMHQERPPIRALLPGRCFRYEAIDASHASEFFQVEGLMVDEGTTMGDLKGLLDQFAKAMYGADKRTRFRPGYYPFTEPSVAFDVECVVKKSPRRRPPTPAPPPLPSCVRIRRPTSPPYRHPPRTRRPTSPPYRHPPRTRRTRERHPPMHSPRPSRPSPSPTLRRTQTELRSNQTEPRPNRPSPAARPQPRPPTVPRPSRPRQTQTLSSATCPRPKSTCVHRRVPRQVTADRRALALPRCGTSSAQADSAEASDDTGTSASADSDPLPSDSASALAGTLSSGEAAQSVDEPADALSLPIGDKSSAEADSAEASDDAQCRRRRRRRRRRRCRLTW